MGKLPFEREAFLRAVEAGNENEWMKYNLSWANLRGANLSEANLSEANLREANLDFASLPLWCGSLRIKADKRIAAQIAYHFCSLECDDKDFIMARNAIIDFANQFYRVRECGELEHLPQEAE